jgi:hypothetical protein
MTAKIIHFPRSERALPPSAYDVAIHIGGLLAAIGALPPAALCWPRPRACWAADLSTWPSWGGGTWLSSLPLKAKPGALPRNIPAAGRQRTRNTGPILNRKTQMAMRRCSRVERSEEFSPLLSVGISCQAWGDG